MNSEILLNKISLPICDEVKLSNKSFEDGSNYKIEVPTINSLEALKELVSLAKQKNLKINRITETKGMFLHTANEIKEWVKIVRDFGAELCMSVGPRATYDTSATVNTKDGFRIGYRLRGQDGIARGLEDILRGIELGVKSFLLYDEGLLSVVSKLKKAGHLDGNIKCKISAHCGYANPIAIKILEELGANSVNPVRDLSLAMISTIRSYINIPLDIHSDNPKSSGGFIRFYEVPQIIKIASPVYIKVGNSAIESHGSTTKASDAINIIRNIEIVQEIIQRYNVSAIQST